MKAWHKRLAVIVGIFGIGVVCVSAYNRQSTMQDIVMATALNAHVSPHIINDDYSSQVFHLFLDNFDPAKLYFTQEDREYLSVFETTIDDELAKGSMRFYETAKNILIKRVLSIQESVLTQLESPIKLTSNQTFQTDPDKRNYAKDEPALVRVWNKRITYFVLNEYMDILEEKRTSENATYKQMYDPTTNVIDTAIEEEARKKVKTSMTVMFERILEQINEESNAPFFDALLGVFDVHTSYFPEKKKDNFDISLSGKLEGIGAVLSEKDGDIIVTRIVPGSAASRQGDLEEGDIIQKVTQSNGDSIDITGMRVSDAVTYIRGKKGTKVTLSVRKAIGEVKDITIVRDIVILEETYAKGVILKMKNEKETIGYIKLPKFYRDFKDNKARNTTDDVRKIVEQLMDSSVDAIILDLRFNEGGALKDAIDTAGLFIKKGPIVLVKGADKENILVDDDPSILYQGPLIIMVNTYSASASEILAAALQDYGRAVIVGSETTFGKGTVQTFINLNYLLRKTNVFPEENGSIKLTIQKFYRITGESTQYKGVTPDIILPDNHAALEVGERFFDHSLPWDKTQAVRFSPWNLPLDIPTLQEKSATRIKNSPHFNVLKKHHDAINTEKENSEYSLDLKEAYARKKSVEKESKAFKDAQHTFQDLTIIRPKGQKKQKNKEKNKEQETFHDLIKKDIHLYETLHIAKDLINLTKK